MLFNPYQTRLRTAKQSSHIQMDSHRRLAPDQMVIEKSRFAWLNRPGFRIVDGWNILTGGTYGTLYQDWDHNVFSSSWNPATYFFDADGTSDRRFLSMSIQVQWNPGYYNTPTEITRAEIHVNRYTGGVENAQASPFFFDAPPVSSNVIISGSYYNYFGPRVDGDGVMTASVPFTVLSNTSSSLALQWSAITAIGRNVTLTIKLDGSITEESVISESLALYNTIPKLGQLAYGQLWNRTKDSASVILDDPDYTKTPLYGDINFPTKWYSNRPWQNMGNGIWSPVIQTTNAYVPVGAWRRVPFDEDTEFRCGGGGFCGMSANAIVSGSAIDPWIWRGLDLVGFLGVTCHVAWNEEWSIATIDCNANGYTSSISYTPEPAHYDHSFDIEVVQSNGPSFSQSLQWTCPSSHIVTS